jgi:hypothetical protein
MLQSSTGYRIIREIIEAALNKGIFLLTKAVEPIVKALHKPARSGRGDQEQARRKIFVYDT